MTYQYPNEYAPEIVYGSSSINKIIRIPENVKIGTIFHRLVAVDKDYVKRNVTSGHELTFRLSPHQDVSDFSIDSTSGEMVVSKELDRETVESYNLMIEVSDGLFVTKCNLSIEVIDVNDNPPLFDKSLYSALINVDTSDSTLGHDHQMEVVTVRATDSDVACHDIYYTLNTSIDTSGDGIYFSINSTSGLITANVAALIQSLKIRTSDRMSHSSSATFTFNVYASDVSCSSDVSHMASSVVHVTVTHSIKCTSPRLKFYPYLIELKNSHPNDFKIGSVVGRIEFASLGEADSVRIEIRDGDTSKSSTPCSQYFNFESTTGSVTVKKRLESHFYECFIWIYGIKTSDVSAPVPTSSLLQIIFSKGISDDVMSRKATTPFSIVVDVDEGQSSTESDIRLIERSKMYQLYQKSRFSIVYSSIDPSSYFSLNDMTGVLSIKRQLDYETLPSVIELIAVALPQKNVTQFDTSEYQKDMIPIYFHITLNIININDHPPLFNQDKYIMSIPEGEDHRGSTVGSVFSIDLDTLGSDVPNHVSNNNNFETSGQTSYEIISGNSDNVFSIDSNGRIKSNSVLDYEITKSYFLRVRSLETSTKENLSSDVDVVIHILDVDDNQPVFPQNIRPLILQENRDVGSVITRFTANDVDTFPLIKYHMSQDDRSRCPFDIDLYTGKIILIHPLTSSHINEYHLKILASDSVHTTETIVELKVNSTNPSRMAQSTKSSSVNVDHQNKSLRQEDNHLYSHFASSSTSQPDVHRNSLESDERIVGGYPDDDDVRRRLLFGASGVTIMRQPVLGQDSRQKLPSDNHSENRERQTSGHHGTKGSDVSNTHPAITFVPQASATIIPAWILILVVLLMLITVVLLFTIVVIKINQHPNIRSDVTSCSDVFDMNTLLNRKSSRNHASNSCLSVGTTGPIDTFGTSGHHTMSEYMMRHNHHGVTSGVSHLAPPCYNEITSASAHHNSSTLEGHSASSGRGSVEDEEDEDDVDEEIRQIIEGHDMKSDGHVTHGNQVMTASEYLARLGIVDNSLNDIMEQDDVDDDDVMSENLTLGLHDVRDHSFNECSSHHSFSSVRSRRSKNRRNRTRRMITGHPNDNNHVDTSGQVPQHLSPDDLIESYEWDYLKDWNPKYQPLTTVSVNLSDVLMNHSNHVFVTDLCRNRSTERCSCISRCGKRNKRFSL